MICPNQSPAFCKPLQKQKGFIKHFRKYFGSCFHATPEFCILQCSTIQSLLSVFGCHSNTFNAVRDKSNLLSFWGSNQFLYKEISLFKWVSIGRFVWENAATSPRESRADEYSQTDFNLGGNGDSSTAESKCEVEYVIIQRSLEVVISL